MADELLTTRAYVYTFVNKFGEEGAPSPASREITVGANAGVVVSLSHAPVAAKYGIVSKRVYRATTGDESGEFRLVTEVPLEQLTIADTLRDDELGEVLPSADWDAPPVDLRGVVPISGDMLAGFRAGTGIVCISAPTQAHAWPVTQRLRFDYPVVGILPLDGSFVVFTEGQAYHVVGTVFAQFEVRPRPNAPRCLGRKSLVSDGAVGYYAAALGPVKTDGHGFDYLLRATNAATDPNRLFAAHANEPAASAAAGWGTGSADDLRRDAPTFATLSDDRLFMAFFYDATPKGGTADSAWTFEMYEFDLGSAEAPFLCGHWRYVCDATEGEEFLAGHVYFDEQTRTFYTLRGAYPSSNTTLSQLFPIAAASARAPTAEWVSKEFTLTKPYHPAVMYVDFSYGGAPEFATATKVRVQVIALVGLTETVIADEAFVHDPNAGALSSPHNWIRRCQVLAGPRSHRIKLRVTLPSGQPVTLRRVTVAENMDELLTQLPQR